VSAIREIADDDGDVVVTVGARLTAGARAEQDHFFHARKRALNVAFVGREAGCRLMGEDFG
jgi:hypothetical protein